MKNIEKGILSKYWDGYWGCRMQVSCSVEKSGHRCLTRFKTLLQLILISIVNKSLSQKTASMSCIK